MGKREHIYEIIAENIRKERRRIGITQAELAERADVSLDTIKSVENGRRAKVYEGGDIEIVLDCDDEYRKIVARAGELEKQQDTERLVV